MPLDLPSVSLPIRYTADGLVPAIAQQHDTGEVLMMAWMNAASVAETLETGRVCYWSRSRAAPLAQGRDVGRPAPTPGGDAAGIAMAIRCCCWWIRRGAACHTGQRSCFHRAVRGGALVTIATPLADPAVLYA